MCYDKKEVANGVVTERQALGSSEEDESRVDYTAGNTNNMSGDTLQISQQQQQQQQQPLLGPVIRWERFLPIRSLKVLLVENDDSTRKVVSALLRNCSYEVTAVSNGLQAWRILEDVNTHIDLVLAEVVMPVLSGISLLCKIMSHNSLNNITVIMMSSHDSMSLVFKCLSMGAADFLVKPIRKNELKNLWQHVWGRCQSSSGSGCEGGTHAKKSVKSESNEGLKNDNNSSSDEEDRHDNGSNGPSIQDGGDNGCGTQSSWTKKVADIDSTLPASPSYQLPDDPDSTCARVIHTKPETFGNGWAHVSELRKLEDQNELDDAAICKDLQGGVCETNDPETSEKENNKLEKRENENMAGKSRDNNAVYSVQDKDRIYGDMGDNPSGTSLVNGKASLSNPEDLPSLELSLTKRRDVGDSRSDDRNVLKHSNQSAFSKYNTATSASKDPTGNVGSCSPRNSPVAMISGSGSSSNPSNQQSNGSSGHNYNTAFSAKLTNAEEPETFRTAYSSGFHPVQNSRTAPPQSQQTLPERLEDMRADMSNALDRTVLNSSVPGSVSGSNNGNSGSGSGSSGGAAVNTENPNGESDNAAGERRNSRMERAAQGEAALMKFRQKRKERCFEKRVRYHSRKKLAEQRPRVKGQFVRQADSKSGNECPSSGMASEGTSRDSDR